MHRKEGKGEAERDKKRETEEGRRGYMKIDKELAHLPNRLAH